jgi:hypothetical protein
MFLLEQHIKKETKISLPHIFLRVCVVITHHITITHERCVINTYLMRVVVWREPASSLVLVGNRLRVYVPT